MQTRQAGGYRRSGPPSPALPLELLTNGAVVPTGPQLAYPGQSRGIKLCRQPICALRQAALEHTEAHSSTPTRQRLDPPTPVIGRWVLLGSDPAPGYQLRALYTGAVPLDACGRRRGGHVLPASVRPWRMID